PLGHRAQHRSGCGDALDAGDRAALGLGEVVRALGLLGGLGGLDAARGRELLVVPVAVLVGGVHGALRGGELRGAGRLRRGGVGGERWPAVLLGRLAVGVHLYSSLIAAWRRDAHHLDVRRTPGRIDDWNRSKPSSYVPQVESLPTSWHPA